MTTSSPKPERATLSTSATFGAKPGCTAGAASPGLGVPGAAIGVEDALGAGVWA
jgi:hypothetical protein